MGRKKAFLAASNYLLSANQLNGCLADSIKVQNFISTCEAMGFKDPLNRRMITGPSMTKKNIIDRLKWLVESAQAGDVLFFEYSGHGTQTADTSYDHHEADGLAEALYPEGAKDWRTDLVTDDEMAAILDSVPYGVNVTAWIDACHSGDGMRNCLNPLICPSPSPDRPRFIPMPLDIANRAVGFPQGVWSRGVRIDYSKQKTILCAACKSTQTAADAWLPPSYNGAFTYFGFDVLAECDGRISYGKLIEETARRVKARGYNQTPELNCAPGREEVGFLQPFN